MIVYLLHRVAFEKEPMMSTKGASIKDIRFLGRYVGFQKSDIAMVK